jgi:hypothetical protein
MENGTKDLAAILKESEKVAVYNELTHKQTLQLRLICEEIDGMLPNIIDDFEGELWIDFEDGVCQVNVSLRFDKFTPEKKKGLVGISKSKKNAAAVGIVGKIRDAIEDFFLDEDRMGVWALSSGTFGLATGYSEGVDYACLWRLEEYRNFVKKEAHSEDWDELEKSVIASVADDVVVSVKGKCAEIVITKKFA